MMLQPMYPTIGWQSAYQWIITEFGVTDNGHICLSFAYHNALGGIFQEEVGGMIETIWRWTEETRLMPSQHCRNVAEITLNIANTGNYILILFRFGVHSFEAMARLMAV